MPDRTHREVLMQHGPKPASAFALALALSVSATVLLSACAEPLEEEVVRENTHALATAAAVDDFDDGDVSDWVRFSGGGAAIDHRISTSRSTSGPNAMKLTYTVVSGGFAGLERQFSTARDWSTSSGLELWVYGLGTGHHFLVQIYDAGSERWESRFTVDFAGWQKVGLPFAGFTAAAWHPSGARVDAVQDFAGVRGMALVPTDAAGAGSVYLDTLTLTAGGTVSPPTTTPAPTTTPPPTTTTPPPTTT